jgi:hypothetical protein
MQKGSSSIYGKIPHSAKPLDKGVSFLIEKFLPEEGHWEYKSCTSKKFFRFEKNAAEEIERGRKKGYLRPGARIYKCSFCVGYHISTQPERTKEN